MIVVAILSAPPLCYPKRLLKQQDSLTIIGFERVADLGLSGDLTREVEIGLEVAQVMVQFACQCLVCLVRDSLTASAPSSVEILVQEMADLAHGAAACSEAVKATPQIFDQPVVDQASLAFEDPPDLKVAILARKAAEVVKARPCLH